MKSLSFGGSDAVIHPKWVMTRHPTVTQAVTAFGPTIDYPPDMVVSTDRPGVCQLRNAQSTFHLASPTRPIDEEAAWIRC